LALQAHRARSRLLTAQVHQLAAAQSSWDPTNTAEFHQPADKP